MSNSISHESDFQLALASRGSQGTANADAGSTAGSPSSEVATGWDPYDVWLQRIERPRQLRAGPRLTRSIP
ncbi:MAG: hypothetical protein NDI84_10095 [Steroidobacteraceae bacterium]|nr:hypothetical protein [Steroidobacteraceae bacterium]